VVAFVVLRVANAVIHETGLPYFKSKMYLPLSAIRETAFDWSSRSRRTYALIGELDAFSPGLKPSLRKETLFRWTEVQLPLLKQGAPTKLGAERSAASFPVLTQTLKPGSLQDEAFSRI
jgi:hypothetical protein